MCACVSQKSMSFVSDSHSLSYCLIAKPRAHQLGNTSWPVSFRGAFIFDWPHPNLCRDYRCSRIIPSFYRVLGTPSQVLMPMWQALYLLSHLPSPCWVFLSSMSQSTSPALSCLPQPYPLKEELLCCLHTGQYAGECGKTKPFLTRLHRTPPTFCSLLPRCGPALLPSSLHRVLCTILS